MEPAIKASGLTVSGDWAEVCSDAAVRTWLLNELRENCMEKPTWKGFEKPDAIILDAEEWSTDNDLLTPSLKVKLRNLMSRHEEEVNSLN
jgi:long-chain acyl-CoA synthetase